MIYENTFAEIGYLLKAADMLNHEVNFIEDMSRLAETGLLIDDDPEPFTESQCGRIYELWNTYCGKK